MSYQPLSKLIAPLKTLVVDKPTTREAGASVAVDHFGVEFCARFPVLLNVGTFAISCRALPVTYSVRPSASRVVHETDLYSIPAAPPPLLQRPGLIEAHRPETGDRLFGDFTSIAWYTLESTTYLIGLTYDGGNDGSIFMAPWSPNWSGEDLDDQLPTPQEHALVAFLMQAQHLEFARDAARFLVVFGLLEQVEDGPLRFELDKTTGERVVRPHKPKGFVEQQRLLKTPIVERLDPEQPIDPATRALAETMARGHLRRTRFGPRREKVRWDYIQGYATRRWVAPKYTVQRDYKHPGLANATLGYNPRRSK